MAWKGYLSQSCIENVKFSFKGRFSTEDSKKPPFNPSPSGVLPYISYHIGMCGPGPHTVRFFSCFGHKKGHRFWPFWFYVEYGFSTQVLNWVCFLEDVFFIITIRPSTKLEPLLLMFGATVFTTVINRLSKFWPGQLIG